MPRILNTIASIGSITAILLIIGCVGSDATDDSDPGVQVDAENYASAHRLSRRP